MNSQNLDRSYLDKKYFIDRNVYNCPFCNRRHVKYSLYTTKSFHWSANKTCYVYFVACNDCNHMSMHLSYEEDIFDNEDTDSKIFYSAPTSFFVIDERIPAIIRELISEAEGCLKMNYLTGASACIRKAIYELIDKEKCKGSDYESKIKFLKTKYHDIDSTLFDVLAHIQDMTSEKIHEQSWDKWDSPNLKLIIESLKTVLYEMYVEPEIRKDRVASIERLKETILKSKQSNKENE